MIFVDASAIISMMTGQDGADELIDRLAKERERICSAVVMFESVAGLCRAYTYSVNQARDAVKSFLEVNELQFVGIGEREFELAIRAYAEFGAGRHPAGLTMGDCFSYACAKANKAALLFSGEAFARTDIRSARLQRHGEGSGA
jgi:ribonuclease VapC